MYLYIYIYITYIYIGIYLSSRKTGWKFTRELDYRKTLLENIQSCWFLQPGKVFGQLGLCQTFSRDIFYILYRKLDYAVKEKQRMKEEQGPWGYISLWLPCPLFLILVPVLTSWKIRPLLYKEPKQSWYIHCCVISYSHYCPYLNILKFYPDALVYILIASTWLDLHQILTFSFPPKPRAFLFPPFLHFPFPWHKQFSRWKLLGSRVGQPNISTMTLMFWN